MKLNHLWMLLLFIKSITLSAQNCDSMAVCDCATKDLSPVGTMLGHEHGKGTWKFSYRYMNMFMNGAVSGTEKTDDNTIFNNYLMSPQSMHMDMHMLMAMYGITNKFSVMAMFNYNVLSMNMNMLPGMTMMHMDGSSMTMTPANSNMSTKTSGLGDTKLYLVYTLLNHDVHHVFLSEGFNIPTGNIRMMGSSDNMMYPDQRLPYMMQMGSGSFDFMPGVTYLLKRNRASYSAQVTSVIRPFDNGAYYHLGNELNVDCWGAYKFFPWISGSVRVEGTFTGAISGKDAKIEVLEPSANPVNYGGQNVSSYLGLNFYVNKGFLKNNKLSVEYGIPLYQNFNGTQLATAYTIYAGWLISF